MSGFGALAGLGGAASAIGGMLGAQSGNRAARKARDFYNQQTGYGVNRNWNALYGAAGGGRAGLDAFSTGAGGLPTPSGNSLLGQQSRIADLYRYGANQIRGNFERGSAGVNNLYKGSEGLAQQYGRGGEALIDQESARQLKATNQQNAARLASMGFGNSTAAANQASQAAIDTTRAANEQKLALRNQALQAQLGVRGQQAGAMQQTVGRQADLYGNLLTNQQGYNQQPIQTQLSMLNSNVMNPWLGQNTTQYYPGYSGAGTGLANAGNALGTYAGYGMTSNLYGNGGGYDPSTAGLPYADQWLGSGYMGYEPGSNRPR